MEARKIEGSSCRKQETTCINGVELASWHGPVQQVVTLPALGDEALPGHQRQLTTQGQSPINFVKVMLLASLDTADLRHVNIGVAEGHVSFIPPGAWRVPNRKAALVALVAPAHEQNAIHLRNRTQESRRRSRFDP